MTPKLVKFYAHLAKKQLLLYFFAALSAVLLSLFIIQAAIMALQNGYGVDTYATNGTFQLYNPLQRMALGQIPGYDFPFFHGVGVVFLHFPLFSLLGENVFAAETAKHFISPLIFIVTSLVFFLAYFKNISKALISTALFTLLALQFIDIIWPGNSLVGVRSSLPVLVAAALLWETRVQVGVRKWRMPLNEVAAIALLGAAFTCGTEQGTAAIVSYVILRALIVLKNTKSLASLVVQTGLSVTFIGIFTLSFLSLLTLGHPYEALKYALVDIPGDQAWYFGTPPNPYANWDNLIPMLISPDLLSSHGLRSIYIISFLALCGVLVSLKLQFLTTLQKRAFLFMAITGVVVFVAGALGGYYAPNVQLLPLQRFAGLIIVALLISFIFHHTTSTNLKKSAKRIMTATKAVVLIFILIVLSTGLTEHLSIVRSYPVKDTFAYVPYARNAEDYAVSSKLWQERLDIFDQHIKEGDTVWSTYTSLYDSRMGMLNPSRGGEDYIIHALGSERRESYESQFIQSKSKYAITLKPTYFMYEEWVWSRHWNFYRHLLENYSIVAENDSHLLWRLAPLQSKQTSRQEPVNLSNTSGVYRLPANRTNNLKVYSVSIDYKTSSGLPGSLLSKVPRYFITTHNTASTRYSIALPPSKSTWSFPVVVMPGEQAVSLQEKVDGLIPSASLVVTNVQVEEVRLSSKNAYMFANNYCSFSTQNQTSSLCKNEMNLTDYALSHEQ